MIPSMRSWDESCAQQCHKHGRHKAASMAPLYAFFSPVIAGVIPKFVRRVLWDL